MNKATLSENPFDEAWLEWFSGVYRKTLAIMPAEQRAQIEAAFFAGGITGNRIVARHGESVLIDAIRAHLRRQSKLPGSERWYCQRCNLVLRKEQLLDGEACPHCRLVL